MFSQDPVGLEEVDRSQSQPLDPGQGLDLALQLPEPVAPPAHELVGAERSELELDLVPNQVLPDGHQLHLNVQVSFTGTWPEFTGYFIKLPKF